MKQVWSCGGGTQSCAIGALIVQGRLPKPDIAVIADTGREMPTTWEYLDAVLRPELAKVSLQIHRISVEEWGTKSDKGIFHSNGQLQLPAYSDLNGTGKLSAFCSHHWKMRIRDRWLSHVHGLTRKMFCAWIGFSFDETKRILRMQSGEEYLNGLIRFPLVSDVVTRRHEAIKLVEDMGWPTPPRSRCWMCPNQADSEWLEVKTKFPKLFQEACDMDESIRTKDPNAFLHSSFKPLRNADLNPKSDLFSGGCHSGECFL